MKRAYHRYVDSEGYVHAGGDPIAVNSGLCGNNDAVEETDDPVDCGVCIAVDRHVRKHAALNAPTGAVEKGEAK